MSRGHAAEACLHCNYIFYGSGSSNWACCGCWVRVTGHELELVPVLFCGMRAAYPVLSADPRRRVEADDGEEGHDLKPADEQLLICDQVSRKRATCGP